VAIGAMAAVTTRLQFLTNIFVLPSRNPLLVAKAVGTAAVLSNNRVILGIGVGWMREEFELLGQDFPTRGRRTNEAIEVLRTLWRGGMAEYHGKFYAFDKLEMSPAPSQPVPIYVGGESTAALRRAARYGDGWISVLHSLEEIKALVQQLARLRAELGRTHAPFDVCVSCNNVFDIDGYRRLADVGVTTLLTMPWALYGEHVGELDAKCRALHRFADEVIQPMK
jgi:probable F420-dependent oxidoreductase